MPSFETALTLIGGPTVAIDLVGLRFLTDPTLDEPSSYQSGAVTLEKTSGPALSLEEIGPVDAVLLSHDQHFDNLDKAGRAFLGRARTTFTSAGCRKLDASRKQHAAVQCPIVAPGDPATDNVERFATR